MASWRVWPVSKVQSLHYFWKISVNFVGKPLKLVLHGCANNYKIKKLKTTSPYFVVAWTFPIHFEQILTSDWFQTHEKWLVKLKRLTGKGGVLLIILIFQRINCLQMNCAFRLCKLIRANNVNQNVITGTNLELSERRERKWALSCSKRNSLCFVHFWMKVLS